MENKNLKWLRIIIYFFIAITVSNIFRFQLFGWLKELSLPYGLTGIKYLLEGLGPLIGAIIIFKLFKKKSSITLLGTSGRRSFIMISIPIILFTAFGIKNSLNLNPHYYGFIVGVIISLYCIFEEMGWRGYLQDELKEFKPALKYLIIGILWYSWHLTFISHETTLLFELKMLVIIIFSAWGIGQIAEKTRSVLASSCFHFIGSILDFSPLLSAAFDNTTRYLIFAIALIVWIIIVNTWKAKKTLTLIQNDK
jgi:uncharacterized protein